LSPRRRRRCAISFYLVIPDLAGFAALLLWGVHMVQTGVQRTFGPKLRSFLAAALSNRVEATSSLHLDGLRDLKQVNSHLIEGAAYPVLRARGALLPTRLRTAADRS
jgi:Na+/phosphate symporter